MQFILKNISGSTQRWFGFNLGIGQEMNLNNLEVLHAYQDRIDVLALLSSADAELYIEGDLFSLAADNIPTAERLINGTLDIYINGSPALASVDVIDFSGAAVSVVGRKVIIKPGTGTGTGIQYQFFSDGDVENDWYKYSQHHAKSSNDQPLLLPFDFKVTAIVYTNDKDGSDTLLQIFKNGIGSGQKIWELDMINTRQKIVTNNLSALTFSAGDAISMYSKKSTQSNNKKPNDAIVELYGQFTGNSLVNISMSQLGGNY